MSKNLNAVAAALAALNVEYETQSDGVISVKQDGVEVQIDDSIEHADVLDAFVYWGLESDPKSYDLDLTPLRAVRFLCDTFDW